MVQTLTALALIGGFTLAAQAQVSGSGWTSYSPGFKVQNRGSGSNSGMKFTISSSTTSDEERSEYRYDDITSTYSQMQGNVVVNSLGGDRISIAQIHGTPSATSLLGIKKPGVLYEVATGATVGNLAIGSSARINMVVNTKTGVCQIYLNGSAKTSASNSSLQTPYYHKIGVYRTGSGKGPVTVTWSSVKFWKK